MRQRLPTIVLAEDDQDDYLLISEAFEASHIHTDIRWVKDGRALCDYLQRRDAYCDPKQSPWPDLILLDLNMPKMNGFEVLREIKRDPALKAIPVVVLTTSGAGADIDKAYQYGASSYIKKPIEMAQVIKTVSVINQYWLEIVSLPMKGISG